MPASNKGIKNLLWPVWVAARQASTFRNGEVILYKHDHELVSPMVIPSLDIRRVSQENIADVSTMDSLAVMALYRNFLELGDWGYYAYLDDKVAHRSWVKFFPQSVPTWYRYAPFRLQEKQAFIHFCRTSQEARGRGVYPAVLSRAVADCYQAGLNEVWIATDLQNIASRHGIEKAGFVEVERKQVHVFFGIPIYRPASNWSVRLSA